MEHRSLRSWWVAGAVVVLVVAFAVQAVTSLRHKFTTFDEGHYLSGGYSYLSLIHI